MAYSGLYTAMAGLETDSRRLAAIAQDVSNINTTGYAASEAAAMAVPYQGSAALPGADVIPLQAGIDTQPGPIQRTGSAFDLAISHGWLLVRTRQGSLALTRNGALAQGSDGILVTQGGATVLGADRQPISLPRLRNITISGDGTISGIPADSAETQPRVYGRLFLAATPASGPLAPIGNSLYALPQGIAPAAGAGASVTQGALEGSNVNPVNAMIGLISSAKSYALLTQTVGKSSQMATALDQIMMSSG